MLNRSTKPMRRTPMQQKTPLKRTCGLKQGGGRLARTQMKTRSRKKAPRKAERTYLDRVAALGCACCRRLGLGATPAEIHHPRKGAGMGQRAAHRDAIPLCPEHHRGNTGIHGLGVKRFAVVYGFDEAELTRETQALLIAYLPPKESA